MATPSDKVDPVVRAIAIRDVVEALIAGVRDFQAAPVFGLTFGAIYAVAGMVIVLSPTAFGMGYLAYPLAAGFALIGPFVAVCLYEVSRLREAGATIEWREVLRTPTQRGEIAWMGFVTLFIFIVWMYQVRLLVALFLGLNASFPSLQQFITMIFTTPHGLLFLLVGNLVGAVFALILFSLTVVSFPLLLDRDVDFVTAMITSVRAVTVNPVPMLGWAAIIAVLLMISGLLLFVGLLVTLPILGHATWHLYRRLVVPAQAAEGREPAASGLVS